MYSCIKNNASSAGIKHKIIRDKESVTLHCPLSVEGKVTWSRESHGSKADVLTTDGNVDVRHSEDTRFGSLPDKSLVILKPTLSDSGRYLCNNEPAVQLTVISPGNTLIQLQHRVQSDCAAVIGFKRFPPVMTNTDVLYKLVQNISTFRITKHFLILHTLLFCSNVIV